MNRIPVTINKIDSHGSLHLVEFSFFEHKLSMMSLELNQDIHVNSHVILLTKAVHILLAKDFSGFLSDDNRLPCKVTAIEHGKLLCDVTLQTQGVELHSIITQSSAQKMNLQVGDTLSAFLNASELSILRLNDV